MRRHNLGFLVLSFALACTETPTEARQHPAAMTAVSPQSVTGIVYTDIDAVPAVRITDEFGRPVAGVQVIYQTQNNTRFGTSVTVHSDANGIASMGEWKLGKARGIETATATSSGLGAVTFTAVVNPDVPVSFTAPSGNGQKGERGKDLLFPINARITDRFGNGVAGVTIDFAVLNGGGSIKPLGGSASGEDGIVQALWTLGELGENSVIATAAGFEPLTYEATAVDLGNDVYQLDSIGANAGPVFKPRSKIGLLPNGRFISYIENVWGEGTYLIHDGIIELTYSNDFLPRLSELDYSAWGNVPDRTEYGLSKDGVIQIPRCFTEDCFDTVWFYRKLNQ